MRQQARNPGMTLDQEAMVLAIAYVESGFNPDAAAGITGAKGLGQFIRKTGASCGLTDSSRWDTQEQARATVQHTLDNYKAARDAGLGDEYVYARHHDGSFTNACAGVDLARASVVPKSLKCRDALTELTPDFPRGNFCHDSAVQRCLSLSKQERNKLGLNFYL
ncbi:MAG: transglycosylase SLT domain-containing protein [Pararhodobacter sp.]